MRTPWRGQQRFPAPPPGHPRGSITSSVEDRVPETPPTRASSVTGLTAGQQITTSAAQLRMLIPEETGRLLGEKSARAPGGTPRGSRDASSHHEHADGGG